MRTPQWRRAGRFVGVAWGATHARRRDGCLRRRQPRRRAHVWRARPCQRRAPATHAVAASNLRTSRSCREPDREPSIVVVWTAKATTARDSCLRGRTTAGESFARAAPVPGSDAPGNRGWESIAIDRDGRVVAVWLDHREMADGGGRVADGIASTITRRRPTRRRTASSRAQMSKLFFARLDDPAAPGVTGGVCYCCKTGVATGADGSIFAAWRHVYPGNIRDIAFTMSRDGGRTFAPPARVSEDRWVLDGCPENGPAMAVDRGRHACTSSGRRWSAARRLA